MRTDARPDAYLGGLYPILSDGGLEADELLRGAQQLAAAGCLIIQLRIKQHDDRDAMALLAAAARALHSWHGVLVVNDRADMAAILQLQLGAGSLRLGLHLGQNDLPVSDARRLLGPDVLIGLSTHDRDQVVAACAGPESPDYLGIGPIFTTTTKVNPDPVVGLDGLAAVASLSRLPLVAIGGISVDDAARVRDAGAASVAMISALTGAGIQGLAERSRALLETLA